MKPLLLLTLALALLFPVLLRAQERAWKKKDVDFIDVLHESDAALTIDPNNVANLQRRAFGLLGVGRNNEAIALYTNIMARDSKQTSACLFGRACGYQDKGDFEKAAADFETCLQQLPMTPQNVLSGPGPCPSVTYSVKLPQVNPMVVLSYAWLLATCGDDTRRDGKRALFLLRDHGFARGEPEGDKSYYPPAADTLAAAYAETGDFGRAIALETSVATDPRLTKKAISAAKNRLALYRRHQPYHTKSYFFPDFR